MYAFTVALNHNEIGDHPERISKILPYISKYNWDILTFHHKEKIGNDLNKTILILL